MMNAVMLNCSDEMAELLEDKTDWEEVVLAEHLALKSWTTAEDFPEAALL
jgi:hypothetical protein